MFADVDDFFEFVWVVEAVVVAGAGLGDVDGGEDAALQYFGSLVNVIEFDGSVGKFILIDSLLWIERDDPKSTNETDIKP